jgi:hypothetical protein
MFHHLKINILIMLLIDFSEISNLFTSEDVIRMGYSDFSDMEYKLLEELKLIHARQVKDGVPQVDENQKRIFLASSLAEVLSKFGVEKAAESQFANEKGVEPQPGCSRAGTTDSSVETGLEGESVDGQLLIKMKWLLGHVVDPGFVLTSTDLLSGAIDVLLDEEGENEEVRIVASVPATPKVPRSMKQQTLDEDELFVPVQKKKRGPGRPPGSTKKNVEQRVVNYAEQRRIMMDRIYYLLKEGEKEVEHPPCFKDVLDDSILHYCEELDFLLRERRKARQQSHDEVMAWKKKVTSDLKHLHDAIELESDIEETYDESSEWGQRYERVIRKLKEAWKMFHEQKERRE